MKLYVNLEKKKIFVLVLIPDYKHLATKGLNLTTPSVPRLIILATKNLEIRVFITGL